MYLDLYSLACFHSSSIQVNFAASRSYLFKAFNVVHISFNVIGVIETGLFVNMAECAIFGKEDGTVSKR